MIVCKENFVPVAEQIGPPVIWIYELRLRVS
jgi:hypothetical protein